MPRKPHDAGAHVARGRARKGVPIPLTQMERRQKRLAPRARKLARLFGGADV